MSGCTVFPFRHGDQGNPFQPCLLPIKSFPFLQITGQVPDAIRDFDNPINMPVQVAPSGGQNHEGVVPCCSYDLDAQLIPHGRNNQHLSSLYRAR